MPLTLLQQMQQLDALQQRTHKYYSLFTTTQQQQQRNQFLDHSNVTPQDECLFASTQKRKTYVAPQLEQEQDQRQIYESQLITTRDDVNISRIFQDIILTDNPNKKQKPMGVQLVLQNGQATQLDLESNKNDDYSLSNFSSFNVHREEDSPLEFRDLLECIQKNTGRSLSKAGIQRIIEQIANQAREMNEQSPREQEKATVQNSHYLSCGESSFPNASQVSHKFDTALNNMAFHRNRTDRQSVLQCSKNASLLSANISVYQQQTVSPDCASKAKHKFKSVLKQDKENGIKPPPKQTIQKELRIIRKSNPKQLLMLYSDMRQVDQFCITNKIYGKEKEKVLKAVQSNKNNLLLQ